MYRKIKASRLGVGLSDDTRTDVRSLLDLFTHLIIFAPPSSRTYSHCPLASTFTSASTAPALAANAATNTIIRYAHIAPRTHQFFPWFICKSPSIFMLPVAAWLGYYCKQYSTNSKK